MTPMSPITRRLLLVISDGSPSTRAELVSAIHATVKRMATKRGLIVAVTEEVSERTARRNRKATRNLASVDHGPADAGRTP